MTHSPRPLKGVTFSHLQGERDDFGTGMPVMTLGKA